MSKNAEWQKQMVRVLPKQRVEMWVKEVFESEVMEFDDGEGGKAKCRMAVALAEDGTFDVLQKDLDANGEVWNVTPCFHFKSRDAAIHKATEPL